jgi:hypothetical protein
MQLADALHEVLPWGMHKPWALVFYAFVCSLGKRMSGRK